MEEAKLQIFIHDSNYNLEQGKFDKIPTIVICNNCDLIGWWITLLHTTRNEKSDHNNEEFGALSKLQKLNEQNDMLVWC
jgi:hypothetical protein